MAVLIIEAAAEGTAAVSAAAALLPRRVAAAPRAHKGPRRRSTCLTGRSLRKECMRMGDQSLSSAGTERRCALPMRLPDPRPVLDNNRAHMGREIVSSTGAGVWREASRVLNFSL